MKKNLIGATPEAQKCPGIQSPGKGPTSGPHGALHPVLVMHPLQSLAQDVSTHDVQCYSTSFRAQFKDLVSVNYKDVRRLIILGKLRTVTQLSITSSEKLPVSIYKDCTFIIWESTETTEFWGKLIKSFKRKTKHLLLTIKILYKVSDG